MNRPYYKQTNLTPGGKARLNQFPFFPVSRDDVAVLNGQYTGEGPEYGMNATLRITGELLTKGLLVLGSAGAGKTNVIQKLFSDVCVQQQDDDLILVYDVKGDYKKAFYQPETDYLLDPLSYIDVWNLYDDIIAFSQNPDGTIRTEEVRLRALDIASLLFEGHQSAAAPYFYHAAIQTVAGIIELNLREWQLYGNRSFLNNRALLKELRGLDAEGYRKRFLDGGDDFRALAANFDPQINDGRGIVTEISTMVGRRLVGSYAANGSLSLVELVKNRGKKVLFIENDLSMGDALSPVISTVVDQLIAAAASPRFTGRGRIFLFLDELPTLRVKKLAMALTLLRQNRLCVIAGVQNIDRMYMNEPNNRSEIDALLASFQNLILMRNDGNTASYISSRLGKTKVRDRFDNPDGSAGFSIREEAVIETEELRSLGIGDAFCRLGYDPAFRFHFNRYTIRNG